MNPEYPEEDPHDDQILFYTTGEAAKILRVNVSTIQDWLERDYLDGWKLPSGHRRISRESVDRIAKLGAPRDAQS